uniref:Si:ch211-241b2.5 n=1 Tax=Sinocyclocheilus rhinocerous TaxID=307959 RepID=A0A673GRW8_9TELE
LSQACLIISVILICLPPALFTVGLQESSYEAELHEDVRLVCLFSTVKSLSDLTVIWSRVEPKPAVDVYRLERGRENHIYTSAAFIKRAQLIHEQLNENRAVLHLKKLQIKDSGTYRCIVKEADDGDYKQVSLSVTAPYTPMKKAIMKTGQDEVELSCESQGFPSAQVIWSDGQNTNLTEMSNSTTRSTDEDLIHVISKLTVKRDLVNNYTCSFLVKGEIQQTATFSIPGESDVGKPTDLNNAFVLMPSCFDDILVEKNIIFLDGFPRMWGRVI